MNLSRRGFLKAGALTGVAVALGKVPTLPAPPPAAVAPVVAAAPVVPVVRKMATWIPVTNEVLEDNFHLEGLIRDRMARAVIDEQDAILRGES